MKELTEKNTKTKVVIEDKAREMMKTARRIKQIREEIKDNETQKEQETVEVTLVTVEEADMDEDQEVVEVPGPKTTQAIYCEKCKGIINKEKTDIEEINNAIQKITTELSPEEEKNELETLVKKDWPEKVFKNSTRMEGKITKQPMENVKVLIIPSQDAKKLADIQGNWIEKLVDQPGILQTAGENINKPILCEKQSKFKILGNTENKGGTQKKVFLVVSEHKDIEQLQELFSAMKNIAAGTQTEQEIYLTVVGGEKDEKTTRKLIELAFYNTATQVKLIQPEHNKKKKETEVIIVRKEEGSTYAEMARKVKSEVNPTDIGVSVTAIRETKRGDVLITTRRGDGDTLKKEIERKVENARVETRFGLEFINIIDLDSSCTKEEIAIAVGSALNKPKEIANVRSIRPNRFGTAVATVSLPAIEADKLLKLGAIKVGEWVWSRIKPKITVDRCLNCLQLGHITSRCRKQRETVKRCFNCGLPGHVASECTNQKFCGH